MSELTVRLAPLQEIEIARELERLFMLQDRPMTHDRKNILVAELANTGITFKALIAGIRALVDQDLKQIKFFTIVNAARQFTTYQDAHGACHICNTDGFVYMRGVKNELTYTVAYPCTCARGKETAMAQSLIPWNGKKSQHSNHIGMMTLVFPDPKKVNVPEMEDREYAATACGNQTEDDVAWAA
jgi:hypothetical protein